MSQMLQVHLVDQRVTAWAVPDGFTVVSCFPHQNSHGDPCLAVAVVGELKPAVPQAPAKKRAPRKKTASKPEAA